MSPLNTFVPDFRAALPACSSTPSGPMTPPDTPLRPTKVVDKSLERESPDRNEDQTILPSSNITTVQHHAKDSTDPLPDQDSAQPFASINEVDHTLAAVQLHSLTLQNNALHESLDQTNLCYDLLASDLATLQTKYDLMRRATTHDRKTHRDICKQNLSSPKRFHKAEQMNVMLKQQLRDLARLVKIHDADREDIKILRNELVVERADCRYERMLAMRTRRRFIKVNRAMSRKLHVRGREVGALSLLKGDLQQALAELTQVRAANQRLEFQVENLKEIESEVRERIGECSEVEEELVRDEHLTPIIEQNGVGQAQNAVPGIASVLVEMLVLATLHGAVYLWQKYWDWG